MTSIFHDDTAAIKENVLVALGQLIYVKIILAICYYLVFHKIIPADISRKIIHIAAGSLCLFWPYYNETHWTWRLNIFVPSAYAIQLVVKALIICDPNDLEVRTICRTGKPIELLYGPSIFCIVLCYCGLLQFKQELGIYIMGSLTYGDGIAALIGKRYPVGRFSTLGENETKTLSGSLAMLFGSIVGMIIFAKRMGVPDHLDIYYIIGMSFATTLAEAFSGVWDNIAIAVAVHAFSIFYRRMIQSDGQDAEL